MGVWPIHFNLLLHLWNYSCVYPYWFLKLLNWIMTIKTTTLWFGTEMPYNIIGTKQERMSLTSQSTGLPWGISTAHTHRGGNTMPCINFNPRSCLERPWKLQGATSLSSHVHHITLGHVILCYPCNHSQEVQRGEKTMQGKTAGTKAATCPASAPKSSKAPSAQAGFNPHTWGQSRCKCCILKTFV